MLTLLADRYYSHYVSKALIDHEMATLKPKVLKALSNGEVLETSTGVLIRPKCIKSYTYGSQAIQWLMESGKAGTFVRVSEAALQDAKLAGILSLEDWERLQAMGELKQTLGIELDYSCQHEDITDGIYSRASATD